MISVEKIALRIAEIGEPNPLPDIKNNTYIHASIVTTDKIKRNELPNINKGMIPTIIPYLTQDGYTRNKHQRDITIIVLENEYLRAEFMPEFGGRLRRLYDKEKDLELLYVNPVFQPCNLALRNAWFSGGVEFNVGIKGHNLLTCSPLFAEKRINKEGEEYLSLYEYERIRGVVWSVNAFLPKDARMLTLRCSIENTEPDNKYMYWWSNIAVEEKTNTRVIVPTDETYINYFGNDNYILDSENMPNALNTDISYPLNATRSLDYFYKIPTTEKKWIAAVDSEGKGLLQTSENILLGRKLFVWGTSEGGKHWSEYLSVENSRYIEIQAGLTRTQLEHFVMEGNSKIEWIESYSAIDVGYKAHGEWQKAKDAVKEKVNDLPALYAPKLTPASELAYRETLYRGSGWGAIEEKLRGEKISDYFDEWTSDASDTKLFDAYLEYNALPEVSPLTPPPGYVIGKKWEQKLLSAKGWLANLLLGVVQYHQYCYGDKAAKDCAITSWKNSIAATPNPWAMRNLAAFYANELKDYKTAIVYSLEALKMLPSSRALAIDYGQILFAAERAKITKNANSFIDENGYALWLNICDSLTGEAKTHSRVMMLKAKAYIELDMLDQADEILNDDFCLADIKEGEISISEIWFELKAKQKGISVEEAKAALSLPYQFDFRMH